MDENYNNDEENQDDESSSGSFGSGVQQGLNNSKGGNKKNGGKEGKSGGKGGEKPPSPPSTPLSPGNAGVGGGMAAGSAGGAATGAAGGAAGAGAAAGSAAAEGTAAAAASAGPVIGIILAVIIGFFLLAFFIKNFNQIYFQGHLGFEDAAEYADISGSQTEDRTAVEVPRYYADDPERYEQAMEWIQELLDQYIEQIEDEDAQKWLASPYANNPDYVYLDPEIHERTAQAMFPQNVLEEFVESYILDKGTEAHFRQIEDGGGSADGAISQLEERLLHRELDRHSAWLCETEDNPVITEVQEPIMDPATGEQATDPSTGELLFRVYYTYQNIYKIETYAGDGEPYPGEGVQWDVVKDDEDLQRSLDLYHGEDNHDADAVKDGLEQFHSGNADSGDTNTSFFARIGAFLSNFFASLWEAFQRQFSNLKQVGPVPKVTTLKFASSSYDVSASYSGMSAARAAIELCRNCQYVWGGKSVSPGVDCSGLVYVAYTAIGYTDIKMNSYEQREQCEMLQQAWSYDEWWEQRIPGDLLLMNGHVVMYVGTTDDMRGYGVSDSIIAEEGLVSGIQYCIEASSPNCDKIGDGVKFTSLESNMADSRFLEFGRPYETAEAHLDGDVGSLYTFLISSGVSQEGAAGILGNIQQESDFSPLAHTGSFFGIAQWGGGRLNNLKTFCQRNGLDYKTVSGQAEFLVYEMQHEMGDLWDHLKASNPNHCSSASWAAQDFCVKFERCVGGSDPVTSGPNCFHSSYLYQQLGKRIQYAVDIYNQCVSHPSVPPGTVGS